MRSQAAALGAVAALTVTALTQVPVAGVGASGSVYQVRGAGGTVRFVGTTGETRDAAVTSRTGRVDAARLHLRQYAGALGLDRPGTRLLGGRVTRSVTGHDVVRFREVRRGLPVIGGAVAVDLRPDRQLGSIAASVSRATVPRASYPSRAAARTALALALRRPGHPPRAALVVGRPSRRLYDPAVLGVPRTSDPTTRARGVWRVVVHAGVGFRRLVLVDDRTGAVVLDLDLVEHADRVVCDDDDTYAVAAPCVSGFARTEGDPPAAVADVNDAYDLAGVVSDFYRTLGGLDLTRLLGVDVHGHPRLAATVRFCEPAAECPLQNAFWSGQQMFYGTGFASADDVVGHEMTHGVIEHNANLLYWGQSGAINESLADIMGELIDHAHPGPGDGPHSWTLGEDLPIGAIRSIARPKRFGQPASMTSPRYVDDIDDNGGVHTDSGVGNKTLYLISQGGSSRACRSRASTTPRCPRRRCSTSR